MDDEEGVKGQTNTESGLLLLQTENRNNLCLSSLFL